MTLDPRSFFPPPKVRSAVVVLDPDRKPFASAEMIELLSVSFRMRRKKLINNLIGFRELTRNQAIEAMRRANIDEGVRAEELSLEEFAQLHSALGAGSTMS
jgi:16S rRNA (adenine1518-N6/adenine1519-N6)-dimethyltransferase